MLVPQFVLLTTKPMMRKDKKPKRLREGSSVKEQEFPGGFDGCVRSMAQRPGVTDPKALCAFIGRRAGKIPGSVTEQSPKPLISQVGEKWCILKPDGTPDICWTGADARDKAEAEALKRQAQQEGMKETIIEKDGKFCVISKDGTKQLGCYETRADAQKRLGQIEHYSEQEEIAAPDGPFVMMTTPDPADDHTHDVLSLDTEGMGETSEAGTVPHAHDIEAFEVVPWKSEDGSYVSEHPGTFPDDATMAEESAKGRKARRQEGIALYPYSKTSGLPGRFVENGPKDPEGRVWEVVLIEEGMSKNGRLYSREVLKDAFERKVFEGLPAFGFVYRTSDGLILDHAKDGVNTADFPKDVVGFHRNVRYSETSSGKMGLIAEFHFLDEILMKKTLEAFKTGNKGLFGLSIDAVGEGEPLDQKHVEIKYIVRANSDDIVSFPAAGGRFVRMVASMSRGKITEDGSMNKKALLVQLINEVKPSVLQGKDIEKMTVDELLVLIKADEFVEIRKTFAELAGVDSSTAQIPAKAPAAAELATAALVNESRKELDEIKKMRESMARERHNARVEVAIKEASLNEESAQLVRDLAEKSIGDEVHLKACIGRAQKVLESGGWQNPKITDVKAGDEKRDRIAHALEGAMFGRPQKGIPPFKNIDHMIGIATGEVSPSPQKRMEIASALIRGVLAKWNDWRTSRAGGSGSPLTESYRRRFHEGAKALYGLKEAINLAQLTEIFGDSITRQMIADYELPQLNDWRAVASKIGFVDDTRVQRRDRLGYYPDLATVAEGANYVQITSLTDEEVTINLTKHGNFEAITLEALLRNDLGWFAKVPKRLAMTAMQDVRKEVWNMLLGNAAIYDAVALFDAAHANQDANVLSVANFSTARQRMREQTTFGSTFHELGVANIPKFLIVPPELENTANQISTSQFEPTASLFQVANLHKGVNVIVLDQATDANDWFAISDPANIPTLEVDFLGDSDAPELWTDDDPTQGTPFLSDTIRVKVRMWFGQAILDFRPFYRGNPA